MPLNTNKGSINSGKLGCYVERLRKETLYPSSSVNDLLIFVRKLVHTKDGNNILQLVVALNDFFYSLGSIIVLIT